MHMFAKILIKKKYRLKIGLNNPGFCENIDKFWFKMQNN